jgi:phosphoserine phosphatase
MAAFCRLLGIFILVNAAAGWSSSAPLAYKRCTIRTHGVYIPAPQPSVRGHAAFHHPAMMASRNVVVTDMDETLITSKSTGYIVKFLLLYKAFLRLAFLAIPAFVILNILSKFNRGAAVRIFYWLAFRGIRVDKAERIAAEQMGQLYAADLQDPAASAVLDSDEAVILTASPTFMAKPWLQQYLGVPEENVYGAALEVKNGRFTGKTGDLPLGQTKVDLLNQSPACTAPSVQLTGYGDHSSDVPFLRACSRGVLVEELPEAQSAGCEYEPARPMEPSVLAVILAI